MKRRYMIFLILVLALAVLFFYGTNPMRHTKTFVNLYSDRIQDAIESGAKVPENLGCLDVDVWVVKDSLKLAPSAEDAQTALPAVPEATAAELVQIEAEDVGKFKEPEIVMTEFVLSGWGIGSNIRYYGCYYSRDDIPFPFRSAGVSLIQNGHDYWTWTGEGGNKGATQKIRDNWYYFEASF